MKKELMPILETKEESEIKGLIYNFRGKEVMLDSDIAELFKVETKKLNQQVKRNQNRFPEDFCFKLNSIEFKILRSQNVTSFGGPGGKTKLPFVFTEQGIIALAGVLKSGIADEMCVKISRVFVKMRHAKIAHFWIAIAISLIVQKT